MASNWDEWEQYIAISATDQKKSDGTPSSYDNKPTALVPASILDGNDIDMWRTFQDVSEYFQQFGMLSMATYDGFVSRVMQPNAHLSCKNQPRPLPPNLQMEANSNS